MAHPFTWLPLSVHRRAFVMFLVLALVLLVAMRALDAPLKNVVSPSGIVSFELAGELRLAQRIVEAWGPAGRVYAGLSLGLDYLFMVAYASSISLGCVLVAHSSAQRAAWVARLGVALAWAVWAAALLDAVENWALIQVLLGSQAPGWPAVARGCALPKFAIVALGLVYIGGGAIVALGTKLRSRR